jgi:hypothetical protein
MKEPMIIEAILSTYLEVYAGDTGYVPREAKVDVIVRIHARLAVVHTQAQSP